MKKFTPVLAVISCLTASLFVEAQEENSFPLPPVAQQMAEKLAKWEASEKAALEKKIAEKRLQVTKVLSQQLQEVTRSGNLEGALAIKNYISSISPAPANEQNKEKPTQDGDFGEIAGNWDWGFDNQILTINPDGSGKHSRHGGIKLSKTDDKKYIVTFPEAIQQHMKNVPVRLKFINSDKIEKQSLNGQKTLITRLP